MRMALVGATTTLTGGKAMAAAAGGGSKGFSVVETDVAALQAAMQRGDVTAQALVAAYLDRIAAIDQAGPRLNSVIERNPDALQIAAALDAERAARGPRGPLHGIPVLIKDNIATVDRMQTTAGSLALVGVRPPREAFITECLRAAGAVILGKTNLSEWANFRSTRSSSGWSGRGGLSKNPYALDRNTSGSSSGSGAAIAASLAAVAVGTETDGSIVSPASMCGLVGLKPTVGLVSRSGIIPISASQDTAGPMARSVADAAALLNVLAGADARDAVTTGAEAVRHHGIDYLQSLDANALRGARIGVVRANFGGRNDLGSAVVEQALTVLAAQGAVLVDVELPNNGKYGNNETEVLLHEFKAGVNAYLAECDGPDDRVRTVADVIAFNERHRAQELPYFGQELLIKAHATTGLDSPEYLAARAACLQLARSEGIDRILAEARLDALVAPSNGPAWLTDFIRGDNGGGGFSQAAAVAGYPHVTVPAGQVAGLPVGISFVGAAWSEAKLIGLAYAYEQAARPRRAPTYAASITLV